MLHYNNRTIWVCGLILFAALNGWVAAPAAAQLKEVLAELFKPSVPRAIERGLAPGGDLAHELTQVGEVEITTFTQARAIIKLAKTFPRPAGSPRPETESYQSALAALTTLYENVVDSSPAMDLILEQGIPELVRIYDAQVQWLSSDQTDPQDMEDLVAVLSVLAMYCTPEGTDRVMHGIEHKLSPDNNAWRDVFAMYTSDNPETDRFLTWVSRHLPDETLGQSLLAIANEFASEQVTYRHPFNNARGADLIKQYLASEHEYPVWISIDALPYLDASYRKDLFEQTDRITSQSLRLKVAHVRAKVDDEVGFKRLEEFCLDVQFSATARRYLEELKSADRIPEAALETEFMARADMCEWLADARELGSPPEELSIVEQRELKWFDTEEPTLFSIVKFRQKSDDPLLDDDRGIGLVGSMTMSFMDPDMLNYMPEDIYALHYGWEAEVQELVTREERPHDAEAIKLELQKVSTSLEGTEVVEELKFDPTFEYPRTHILIVATKKDGEAGLTVLDGERSRFYSNAEFGTEVFPFTIGRIHIGRTKLGFDLDVKREYKPYPTFQPPPQLVLDTYQELFQKLTKTTDEAELEETLSRLALHYGVYLDALTTTGGLTREEAVKQTFETAWKLYHALPESQQLFAFDELDIIGESIVEYAQAIGHQPQQQTRMAEILAELETRWHSNTGLHQLATAAHAVGLEEMAVRLFEKLVDTELAIQHLGEMPHVLASSWKKQGKTSEAKKLLLDALRGCLEDLNALETDESPDKLQSQMERLKATYRGLFPDTADADLKAAGI